MVIDNDADNLCITVTTKSLNLLAKIITCAGQQRYAQAMRNSGADDVIIPETRRWTDDGKDDRSVLPHEFVGGKVY